MFLLEAWNENTLTVGNRGFMGSVNWLAISNGSSTASRPGQPTQATTRQASTYMVRALNQPEAKTGRAYHALHGSVVLAKKVVASPTAPAAGTTRYYSGCSTSGQKSIKSTQDFPVDSGSALSWAPAGRSTRQQLWQLKVGTTNLTESSPDFITPGQ